MRNATILNFLTFACLSLFSPITAQAGWYAYAYGAEFGIAHFGSGDATGFVELVPGFGSVNDFGSFTSGHVALIERGMLTFTQKVVNAQNAGAIGVIILDVNGTSLDMAGYDLAITIPSVRIEESLGAALQAELLAIPSAEIKFHLSLSPAVLERFIPDIDSVPEPGTLALCGFGLAGVGFSRRRVY